MSASPHFAVIGAGPVGTLIAAALRANDLPFTWVERKAVRRQQLAELSLQFPEGSQTYDTSAVNIRGALDQVPTGAKVILAVKAQDVSAVLAELGPRPPASTLVIANGLHDDQTGVGLLFGGGFLKSGVLVTNRENELIAGGLDSAATDWDWATAALNTEFLRCSCSTRMRELMWHKLAVNCVVNPLTAMLDCDNGDLLGKLHGPLVQGIIRETLEVMSAVLGDPAAVPTAAKLLLSIKQVLRATRYNSSSMREDLRQGNPTEIDYLNGAVVAEGGRRGVACPVNEALASMIFLLASCAEPRGAG